MSFVALLYETGAPVVVTSATVSGGATLVVELTESLDVGCQVDVASHVSVFVSHVSVVLHSTTLVFCSLLSAGVALTSLLC